MQSPSNFAQKEGMGDGFHQLFREDIRSSAGMSHAEKQRVEEQLRYSLLPQEERELVDQILRGSLPLHALPQIKSRVVRIFTSSTFTDMLEERNALMGNIYPKLKVYCRERHGIEFQVVDMRWGVPPTARDDHSTIDLCLNEVRNCQNQSVGPNFVAFIGQKHGVKVLPPWIIRQEFEPIRQALVEMDEDVALLDQWYLKDSNAQPSVWVLQPISSILEDETKWWDIFERLLGMLAKGAAFSVEKGNLDREALIRFKASVTELEILEGLLNVKRKEREDNCLCFARIITDLEQNMDKACISRYTDIVPNTNTIKREANDAITKLREERVKEKMPNYNIYVSRVNWREPLGIDKKQHSNYLDTMCNVFYAKVKELVDRNVEKQYNLTKDELFQETLRHWHHVKTRCNAFLGRQNILDRIRDYILSKSDQPLVLYGESGYGKTSIMAKAANQVNGWLREIDQSIQTTVVIRFCGTTPASSNIRQLLKTICHQVAYTTEKYRHEIPEDFKEIKKYFQHLVRAGEFRGLVVIFFDAIDQLSPEESAHAIDWLPARISNNVKIIVSTLPKLHRILPRLQSKIAETNNFIEVGCMPPTLCGDIINFWLQEAGRTVQFPQLKVVRDAVNACSCPLFAKLTFEEICLWKSYTEVDLNTLAKSVTACIHKLFERLETKYGKTLVSHALSYITASRIGVSEAELEDMLSLDDEVLNSVFLFWEPPIRRIPPALWPRIRHDIDHYLVEREADDTSVIYWYHRVFIEVAQKRYFEDSLIEKYIHGIMSEYFLGTWSFTFKKPYKYQPFLMNRLRRTDPNGAAIRYVPTQPLIYNTFTGEHHRYNLRKINQMPYHLAKAGQTDTLSKEVYFNFEWIFTKLKASSAQQLINDYGFSDSREVSLVADALRMSESALAVDPHVLPLEISGRLLPHYDTFPNVRVLIDQCDLAAIKHCPVVPNWQLFTSPGGPLQYVCEPEVKVKSSIDVDIIQNEDTVFLTAKPFHGSCMRVWDVTRGEPRPDVLLISGSEVHTSPNGKLLNLFKNNRYLQTYKVDSGELYGEVDFGHNNLGPLAIANKYVAIGFEESPGPLVIDVEAKVVVHRMHYQCEAVAISQDEHYLLCGAGHCVALHEFPLMERKCVIQTKEFVKKMQFTKDPAHFFIMFKNHSIKSYTVDMVRRKAKESGVVSDIEMRDFKLSHTEKYLLVRASRCLFILNAQTEKLIHRIQKMPPGVFLEQLSIFREAGFSPNDAMVVAARHTYLGVWEAATGVPLRLLQSSVSSIDKLFTSSIVNKAICLLEDNTIQVWDLGNLDADVQHCHSIVRGQVQSLAFALDAPRLVCHGPNYAEAKVVELETGEVHFTLQHNEEIDRCIEAVAISPNGRYAVTRAENRDYPDFQKPWKLLKEDKLWDLENGELLYQTSKSRFVVFSQDSNKVVFFISRRYSFYDWSINSYDAMALDATDTVNYLLELPDGDIMGHPTMPSQGNHLVFLMQQCHKQSKSKNPTYEIRLCAYSFKRQWNGAKMIDIHNIWSEAQDGDKLMDVKTINQDNLLLIFGKGVHHYPNNEDGSLNCSLQVPKGALIYNVDKDWLLHKFEVFLTPHSAVENMTVSRYGTTAVDNKFQVFDLVTGSFIKKLHLENLADPLTVRLVLDGKYLVMFTKTKREILVVRSNDGTLKARFFVHGEATCMEVGADDKTIAVGCRDGRVMIVTVILDTYDPAYEITRHLPSRSKGSSTDQVLHRDIHNANKSNPDLKRLSDAMRTQAEKDTKRPPSFKSVGTGVILVQQTNKFKSQACCIQ